MTQLNMTSKLKLQDINALQLTIETLYEHTSVVIIDAHNGSVVWKHTKDEGWTEPGQVNSKLFVLCLASPLKGIVEQQEIELVHAS